MSAISFNQPAARAVLAWRSGLVSAIALVSLLYGYSLSHEVRLIVLIGAPIALAIVLLALLKPDIAAIALLVVTWGFISDIAIKFQHLPSLTQPLVGLLLLALLVKRFTGRRTPLVYDATTWWMAGYLLLIALGLWYAAFPNHVTPLLLDFTKNFMLYLVLINLLTSLPVFERSMWLLLAIGALLGTLSVYQEATHNYSAIFGGLARRDIAYIADGLDDRARASGSTGSPLAYGQQLLVLVPIGLWGLVHGRTLGRKLFAGYATAACLAGIGLSFSRGAYLGLVAALVLFALHIRLNPRYLLVILPIVGLLLWVAPAEFKARYTTLEQFLPGNKGVYSEQSYLTRSVQMQMAFNMFLDHPILGVGGWNYPVLYPSYIRAAGSPVDDKEGNPHSFYLEIAAEHGLAGLLVVGGILALAWSRLRAAQRHFAAIGDRRMAGLAAVLQISLLGYLVTAIFFQGSYPRFLWLQVALAVTLFVIARRQAQPALETEARPA